MRLSLRPRGNQVRASQLTRGRSCRQCSRYHPCPPAHQNPLVIRCDCSVSLAGEAHHRSPENPGSSRVRAGGSTYARASAGRGDVIVKENVELGVRVPDEVRAVQNAAVGQVFAAQGVPAVCPSTGGHVWGGVHRYVVVGVKTAPASDPAAMFRWVVAQCPRARVGAVARGVQPPLTLEETDGAVVAVDDGACRVQPWLGVVVDGDHRGRAVPDA